MCKAKGNLKAQLQPRGMLSKGAEQKLDKGFLLSEGATKGPEKWFHSTSTTNLEANVLSDVVICCVFNKR